MGSGGKAPTRNLYDEISGELNARLDLMPDIFAAEAQFRPQYSGLELGNLEDIIFGTEAGTREMPVTTYTQGFRNTRTGEFSTDRQDAMKGNAPDARTAGEWVPWEQAHTTTKTFDTPGQPGLRDIERNADPATAALWDSLTKTATDELALGSTLDPELARLYTQSVRGGQAARGLGYGPADAMQEGRTLTELGQTLRTQRRATATNQAQLNYSRLQDLINRAQGISAGSGPRLFGSTINANDVFSSNQNAAAANSAARAQQNATMTASGALVAAALLGAI